MHGGEATRKWKPVMMRKKGPDGTYSMRMKKQIYYVCEGNTRMTQTRLSFGARKEVDVVQYNVMGAANIQSRASLQPDTTVGQSMM